MSEFYVVWSQWFKFIGFHHSSGQPYCLKIIPLSERWRHKNFNRTVGHHIMYATLEIIWKEPQQLHIATFGSAQLIKFISVKSWFTRADPWIYFSHFMNQPLLTVPKKIH